ncbi:hypothetical protein [Amycolatopsis sp. CA-230715]|uniref:hypothetical protein n=1 Tax=Amycolatopsis sp. CA-230715 TaxID=2745196 RepID=UPI0020B46160|nr:hypothetical protein [Amycolatopsis sp. CA-230715]
MVPTVIATPACATGNPTTCVAYTNDSGRNNPDPKLSTLSATINAARLRAISPERIVIGDQDAIPTGDGTPFPKN